VIAAPLNDRECLDAITAIVAKLVVDDDPTIAELAARYPTKAALIAWLRSLPQRDDDGAPCDGPKVEACNPPQRLRIAPPDPNCVERAALFCAVAEKLDPASPRQLATVETPTGQHTFPIENDEPVVLDPTVSRNALKGGLYRNAPAPVRLTPTEAVDWICDLATEPAPRFRGGLGLVETAREAMRGILRGFGVADEDVDDVALVLALAEREARAFGPCGVTVVLTTAEALAELDATAWRGNRNARGWRIGRFRVRPHDAISSVARVGARVTENVAGSALRAYLASLGVPPTLFDELEMELNREGLTLGMLGRAAKPGMLEDIATDAMKRRAA